MDILKNILEKAETEQKESEADQEAPSEWSFTPSAESDTIRVSFKEEIQTQNVSEVDDEKLKEAIRQLKEYQNASKSIK